MEDGEGADYEYETELQSHTGYFNFLINTFFAKYLVIKEDEKAKKALRKLNEDYGRRIAGKIKEREAGDAKFRRENPDIVNLPFKEA